MSYSIHMPGHTGKGESRRTPMNRKETAIKTLTEQVEALRTMPEGAMLGDGTDRTMTERRRARYVKEGEDCLACLAAMEDRFIPAGNLLFHDDLMA